MNICMFIVYCTQANAMHRCLATGEGPVIMIQPLKVATRSFRFRVGF